MAVIEGLIRQLRPGWAQYLWGENIGTVVPWAQVKNVEFTRGPLLALATLVIYTAVIIATATPSFSVATSRAPRSAWCAPLAIGC